MNAPPIAEIAIALVIATLLVVVILAIKRDGPRTTSPVPIEISTKGRVLMLSTARDGEEDRLWNHVATDYAWGAFLTDDTHLCYQSTSGRTVHLELHVRGRNICTARA